MNASLYVLFERGYAKKSPKVRTASANTRHPAVCLCDRSTEVLSMKLAIARYSRTSSVAALR
jgi:hypothetical protein